jgi:aminoglycoside 3-N-acetyltransferase
MMTVGNLLGKHVYWSFPKTLKKVRHFLDRRREAAPRTVSRRDLKQHLREIGVVPGALVMVHTSISRILLRDEETAAPRGAETFLQSASRLVDDLLELIGPKGTLVMPTHAAYQTEELEQSGPAGERILAYDPAATPCAVGLANELFRRRKGVLRSLHPYNTLAAFGPSAEMLMRDNLNQRQPLPHGVDSGYYRFCRQGGLVVSVGLPLCDCMTLLHVAEDVRDREWPVKDFFEQRRYRIRINGHDEIHVVRQKRMNYMKYCSYWWRAFGDLTREGIIREGGVEGAPVGWARADEVFDYMMRRNKNSPYPYAGTRLASWRS